MHVPGTKEKYKYSSLKVAFTYVESFINYCKLHFSRTLKVHKVGWDLSIEETRQRMKKNVLKEISMSSAESFKHVPTLSIIQETRAKIRGLLNDDIEQQSLTLKDRNVYIYIL